MKVLHVVPSLAGAWGGPASVVIHLSHALAERGVQCSVFTTRGPVTGVPPGHIDGLDVRVFDTDFFEHAWIAHAPGLASALRRETQLVDLVHIHELWHFPHWAAYRAARANRLPYVISLHGELSPWARQQKALAKQLYAPLLLRPSLRQASMVHALTPAEEAQVRSYGIHSPVRVIPNGVPDSALRGRDAAESIFARFPGLRGTRLVLFLGRLQPQKGVDVLVDAFALVARAHPTAHLLIVGPGNDAWALRQHLRLQTLQLQNRATFAGPLYGPDRDSAIAAADVFVLPSRSEGQSVALLEAMACRVPVIVTPAANYPDVVAASAGLVSVLTPEALAAAIGTLLADPDLARQMGLAAQRVVKEQFTWRRLAARVEAMYADALGVRPKSEIPDVSNGRTPFIG